MSTAVRPSRAPGRAHGDARPVDPEEHGQAPARLWRDLPHRYGPVVVLALLAMPVAVAVVALRSPRFFPTLDLAMTEVRVRDVFGPDTPLVGLPGRIGTFEVQGSHPGPLSFYLLAPVYRLAGSSTWALQLATAVLHLVAAGGALVLARRRGGTPLVAGVAAVLAVLAHGYGSEVLTEPWNPFLPVIAWVVVLLATWSVLCRDLPALPVLVVAGSFCAQTHIPYAGLVAGMVLLAAAGAAAVAWRPVTDRERSSAMRWLAAAAGIGVVLWTPPVLDELRADPGNLTLIYRYFTGDDGGEALLGVGGALTLLLRLLDPLRLAGSLGSGDLVAAAADPTGSVLPGVAVLIAWMVAVIAAARLRHRALCRLHAVAAAALLVGVVSMSRILGKVWYYLLLWSWAVAGLLVLAVAWTGIEWLANRRPGDRRRMIDIVTGVAVGVLIVAVVAATASAPGAERSEERLSAALGALVPATVAGLEDGVGAAPGPDGRYVIMWDDPLHIGAQGYGLVSELERAGLDAFAIPPYAVAMTPQRTLEPDGADAVIVLAVGDRIERWAAQPGAVLLVEHDLRTPAEVAEQARLRDEVIAGLRAAATPAELAEAVDGNLFGLVIDERVPPVLRPLVRRMLEIGAAEAVFVLDPGALPG